MKADPRSYIGLRFLILPVAIGVALGVSEVALRLLVPASTKYHVLWPNRRALFQPDSSAIPGVHGAARYTVNSEGIRGREFGADSCTEYRILAVGGSTTESLYLDDSEAWPALLESMLGHTADGSDVWVGNVGRSGRNARDHVVQVKHLTAQYPSLDAVIVLVGINDLTVALEQGDAYVQPTPITETEAEIQQIRRAFTMVPGTLHNPVTDRLVATGAPWYKATALYQLVKRARFHIGSRLAHRGNRQDTRGAVLEKWRAHRRSASNILHELPDLTAALDEYRQDLEAIVSQTEMRSVRVIFLTQPVLWRPDLGTHGTALLWLGGIGGFMNEPGKVYYSVSALAEAMGQFNDALLEVCRVRGVECIDLARLIPRDTSIFYDDAHFTEHGARTVAKAIVAYLRRSVPFSRP
jgi:lysophospholipase L1-like esterase